MVEKTEKQKVIERTKKAFAGPTKRQLRLQAEAKAKGGLTSRGIQKFESKSKSQQLAAIQKEEEKLGVEPRETIERPEEPKPKPPEAESTTKPTPTEQKQFSYIGDAPRFQKISTRPADPAGLPQTSRYTEALVERKDSTRAVPFSYVGQSTKYQKVSVQPTDPAGLPVTSQYTEGLVERERPKYVERAVSEPTLKEKFYTKLVEIGAPTIKETDPFGLRLRKTLYTTTALGKSFIEARVEAARQYSYQSLTDIGAPKIRETDPYFFRLQKTAFTTTSLLQKGFEDVATQFKESPIKTTATLGGIAVGAGLTSRGLTTLTGIGLARSKQLVEVGILGGFLGYKEVKQPGSVLSLPGALTTSAEFGTYALGAKGIGAGFKSVRFLGPKFIPFTRTVQEGISGGKVEKSIPLFEGTTRLDTAKLQYEPAITGEPGTFYHTTGTTPSQFFGFKPIRQFKTLFGKAKSEVIEPPKGEAGGERLQFGEDFFFASRGEAYPMFGEQAIARIGEVSRITSQTRLGKGFEYGKKLITEFPARFDEMFKSETPTVLRFKTEVVQRFSPEIFKSIQKGEASPALRRQAVSEVKAGEGFYPGTRTTGKSFGEIEYVLPVGETVYRLRGKEFETYFPSSELFARVVDVGLAPSKAGKQPYNVFGRLRNIGEVFVSDVFGITQFGQTLKPEKPLKASELPKFERLFKRDTKVTPKKDLAKIEDMTPSIESLKVETKLPRVRRRIKGRTRKTTRRLDLRESRIRQPVRDIVRFREESRRIDLRLRERVIDRIVRTRERPREVAPRERVVDREIRERLRPREDRVRTRYRALRERVRSRDRGPRLRIKQPKYRPPKPIVTELKRFEYQPEKKKKKLKIDIPTQYRASLIAVGEKIKGKRQQVLTGLEVRALVA